MHVLEDYDLIEHVLQVFQEKYQTVNSCPTLSKKQAIDLLPSGTEQLLNAVYDLLPQKNSGFHQNLTEYSESYFVVPDRSLHAKRFVRVTPTLLKSFIKMMAQLKRDTSTSLKVLSGYRSPAYQAILLLGGYHSSYYDMNATLKRYMPPGYSEHGNIKKLAIDVGLMNKQDEQFDKTNSYKWLTTNAAMFGFYLSYPESQTDMEFEPWHWHYKDTSEYVL